MTNAQLHGCKFEGWQCFHCGEVFTTVGGARDHFGATPDALPGCLLKIELGDARGWLMELRRLQDKCDCLMQEVQCQAQEARTQRTTVWECYQAVTGGTGEPGDWHGAEPVRTRLTELEAEVEKLRHHLIRAHRFIESTEAFGRTASTGIIQAGEDESTMWNLDESKAACQWGDQDLERR
jgi:hypothetical protein